MSHLTKAAIEEILIRMREENFALANTLTDEVSLSDYEAMVARKENDGDTVDVWTAAFQAALNEHQIVRIPKKETPYWIDGTVTIPSNRKIIADEGAVIKQMKGVKVLMLRNEHTADGTHAPIPEGTRDRNITIMGGRWEESYTHRAGYGNSGMYDENRSFFGVSTCMLFNNVEHVTLLGVEFAHTAGFSAQLGDISDLYAESITFDTCYADGMHINGNTERIWLRNLSGQVGDDLVAWNMYDWQDSSINFGPLKTALVENGHSESGYRAIRIEPGTYFYDDGSSVDCSLENAILRNVDGVEVFKMYYQTPPYRYAEEEPEKGDVGSVNNVFFEDIDLDLTGPIDRFPAYVNADPVRGNFGAVEICAKAGRVTFENIRVTLHRDLFPLSHFVLVGPKSIQHMDKEIFDPYVSGEVEELVFKNVTVNGAPLTKENADDYIRTVSFDDLYGDGKACGTGTIGKITVL